MQNIHSWRNRYICFVLLASPVAKRENKATDFSINADFAINADFTINADFSINADFAINADFTINADFSIDAAPVRIGSRG